MAFARRRVGPLRELRSGVRFEVPRVAAQLIPLALRELRVDLARRELLVDGEPRDLDGPEAVAGGS
jgi:hypothetical protein